MSELCGGVRYDPIAVSAESTVVPEYFPEAAEETAYQSEAALEQAFIQLLQPRHSDAGHALWYSSYRYVNVR